MSDDQDLSILIMRHAGDMCRTDSRNRADVRAVVGLESQNARIKSTNPDPTSRILNNRGDSIWIAYIVGQIDWTLPSLISIVESIDDVTTANPNFSIFSIIDVSDYFHLRCRRAAN